MRSQYGIVEIARRRECPTCSAQPGKRCTTSTGRSRSDDHTARTADLWEAFRNGRDVGEESAVRTVYDEGLADWRLKYGDAWLDRVWKRMLVREGVAS